MGNAHKMFDRIPQLGLACLSRDKSQLLQFLTVIFVDFPASSLTNFSLKQKKEKQTLDSKKAKENLENRLLWRLLSWTMLKA